MRQVAEEARRVGPLRLVDSAGFRFAIFFAVMFLLGGVAFSAIVWWNTAGGLDRQTDTIIRGSVAALIERYNQDGREGVIEAIQSRLERADDQDLYRLTDRDGVPLTGNLTLTPEELEGPEPEGEFRWTRIPMMREGERTEARLYRQDLSNGDHLIVGRDVEERLRLRELLAGGLAWAACAAGVLALVGALLLRRALEQRLRPAADTVAAIAQGDLAHRVPMTGREDEFDRLGGTMNAMLDRIASLMAGIRGVSDAIAHDLRTPVARARGRLEEALARCDDPVAMRRAIEQGVADLDGMIRLLGAVLRIAEVEAGARRAAFTPFDLVPVLADAAELYTPSAEARDVALDSALPDSLPLTGDRDLLLQAVANLLDNAVKFTPVGGRIALSAEATPEAIRITVADEGPGLSPAERARAGERFFRTDSARTTPGYGLGLSLVRAVAGLHGGELLLGDARPGESPPGLAATLVLPRTEEE
ncbi:ATP-binding protein [Muricoccus radiodurans]|uniref:sensor histidine kinase n=1 Tax=Muricoccus radiodurans TaxID=2231721 RepID=UPI003CF28197